MADKNGLSINSGKRREYGIAFDIGTTTVVGMLWNLHENILADKIARTNPQSKLGADVISRITYVNGNPEKLRDMQRLIIDCCNELLDAFSDKHQILKEWFRKATVVGNTTMSHFFLGIDTSGLAHSPFKAGFKGTMVKTASELGLHMNDNAEIFVLPNIAGHVGSDIVGVMISSKIEKKQGITIAIDIGTNGEIILNGKGRLLVCSTAAGPAFEGAGIYSGMRAAEGAIEKIKIHNNKVYIEVIGSKEPEGLCGSGIVDAVGMMLDAKILDYKGKLITQEEALDKGFNIEIVNRLRKGAQGNEFVIAWRNEREDIVITQKDIRQIQLAKGAIFAGALVLLECLGAEISEVCEILLAGAFGSNINIKSALRIGLIPDVDENQIYSLGNAAGAGACMALISEDVKREASMLAIEALHVELALYPSFEKKFLEGMYFPKNQN
ncbi:MAG: ASKHA domain-containing protein [Eubacteriales bacterium]|nr:ASKHA domain-containing protein [Eubacteriales bacterium]